MVICGLQVRNYVPKGLRIRIERVDTASSGDEAHETASFVFVHFKVGILPYHIPEYRNIARARKKPHG